MKKIPCMGALALLLLAVFIPAASGQGLINYQGRIQTGTPPADFTGTGQFKFALVAGTADISLQATATANRTNNVITGFTITNPGNGYTVPPAVTISGGGGSGASVLAVISAGKVTAISVFNGGSGYTSNPSVTIAAPAPRQEQLWVNNGNLFFDPSVAVSLPVAGGLYSVLLGDDTIPNMNPIPPAALSRPDVRLRVWFNGTQLSPDQRLAPGGYLPAQLAGGYHFQDQDLYLRGGTDVHHGIGYYGQRTFGTLAVPFDGPVVYGYDGGGLGSNTAGVRNIALSWRNTGRVAIGAPEPKNARLTVVGTGGFANVGANYYLALSGTGSNAVPGQVNDISIDAERYVHAEGFRAFSDARIKNLLGRSDTAADLHTLEGIEITDYTHKDPLGKSPRPQKKVIAQQVEKVFPAAVSRGTGVVPDIFQKAAVSDGWIMLPTSLQKGERVRLLAGNADSIHEVLEVRGDAFRTDFRPADTRVFVYGREVADFRTVDYEAISMLNVSATQQLKKDCDALRAENAALQARVAALEARDARLAALLEKLESKTLTVSTAP